MAVAEMTAPSRPEINYRPKGSMRFGGYDKTVVMPRWVVEQCGKSAEKLVREGILEETQDPVVQDFRAPASIAEYDTTPAMAEELNELRKEAAQLRAENKGLAANNETLRATNAGLKTACAEQTETIAHWRGQAEARRADVIEKEKQIAALESELEMERATRPDAPVETAKVAAKPKGK
jgi:predicted RNase H-like nuclease (RuvC/YqgF family)